MKVLRFLLVLFLFVAAVFATFVFTNVAEYIPSSGEFPEGPVVLQNGDLYWVKYNCNGCDSELALLTGGLEERIQSFGPLPNHRSLAVSYEERPGGSTRFGYLTFKDLHSDNPQVRLHNSQSVSYGQDPVSIRGLVVYRKVHSPLDEWFSVNGFQIWPTSLPISGTGIGTPLLEGNMIGVPLYNTCVIYSGDWEQKFPILFSSDRNVRVQKCSGSWKQDSYVFLADSSLYLVFPDWPKDNKILISENVMDFALTQKEVYFIESVEPGKNVLNKYDLRLRKEILVAPLGVDSFYFTSVSYVTVGR